ncbi:hypothetical protein [Vibrio sp. McD22-P3]|uniref:hypothetical protein n=1 Tax=Vibrio sp. McD22-P3 TaxID=2724880 RepID=UPI001F2D24BB|nr:hypothetical protein [Vibrio sp. McD22-P3]MCF4174887.1 hypothetical protein [Vibrio sp. McD22-P3]
MNNDSVGLKVAKIASLDLISAHTAQPINSMEDSEWFIIDEVDLEELKINWSTLGISEEREHFAKEYIRAYFGKGNVSSGLLYGRRKTVKNTVSKVKLILNAIDKLYGTHLSVSKLSLDDVNAILIELIEKSNGELWSSGLAKQYLLDINHMSTFYNQGLMIDGIAFSMPRNQVVLAMMKDFVESKNIDFIEWTAGGTWNTLTVDVALLVLDYHIKVIESPIVKFLIEYFDFQRSTDKISPELFARSSSNIIKTTFSTDFRVACKDVKTKDKSQCTSKLHQIARIFSKLGYLSDIGTIRKGVTLGYVHKEAKKVKRSALFVFKALTGIRRSEVASVTSAKITSKGEQYFFESSLFKTNHGIKIVRSISRQAVVAIEIASKLSYLKLGSNESPFTAKSLLPSSFDQDGKEWSPMKREDISIKISKAYDDCIRSDPERFSSAPPRISAHALRHVFAAIALRCFKGNVRDSIRRHFGHSDRDRFTQSYVYDKLTDDIVNGTESQFLKDFVNSVGSDDEFYMLVAKRIREKVNEDHTFKSIGEVSEYFSNQVLEAIEFGAHEFGYYIPWDSKDKNEVFFDQHHLTPQSSAEDLTRIGISHQHLMEHCKSEKVKEASLKVVRTCEAMLDELNVDLDDLLYE